MFEDNVLERDEPALEERDQAQLNPSYTTVTAAQ
jgi:hypothetical protein